MYAKVFRELWTGSLVGRSDEQLVFVFLLAHAGPDGCVDVHTEVIGALTGIGLERTRAAIELLSEPDSESRSPDQDGRRIVLLDGRSWGWKVVNYASYRSVRDQEERRAQGRAATARWRQRITDGSPRLTMAQSERGEPKVEGRRKKVEVRVNTSCSEPSLRSASEPPAANIPLNDNTTYPIDQEQANHWAELFPAVDVPQTLREIVAWCEANPTRRKTARGVQRFIVAWLGREQNKGS